MRMYDPPHPGMLLREYLQERSVTEVARQLGVTRVTLSRILNGKASISPEMAVRLSKFLPNTTPKLWLGLQADYDIWQIEQNKSFDISSM